MPVTGKVPLLGDKIREYREALELTQDQLADATGYHRTYVSRVELGTAPGPRFAWNLAKALGVPSEKITVSGLPVPEPRDSQYVSKTRVMA